MQQYFKRGVKIILFLAFSLLLVKSLFAIEIPEYLSKCVLAIGTKDYNYNENTGEQSIVRNFRGTGILVRTDRFILVTAKHVVIQNAKVVPNLCFWGNKRNGTEFMYSFSDIQKKYENIKWIPHTDPKIDIAVSIVELDLEKDDLSFVGLGGFEQITDKDIGSDVYYLGYPSEIGARQGSKPVLRKGMVAHKEKGNNYFYIDAVVSGGNSGGPVFQFKDKIPRLLGIVSNFPYMLRREGTFHTGLGMVFSADCIREILKSPCFKSTY